MRWDGLHNECIVCCSRLIAWATFALHVQENVQAELGAVREDVHDTLERQPRGRLQKESAATSQQVPVRHPLQGAC